MLSGPYNFFWAVGYVVDILVYKHLWSRFCSDVEKLSGFSFCVTGLEVYNGTKVRSSLVFIFKSWIAALRGDAVCRKETNTTGGSWAPPRGENGEMHAVFHWLMRDCTVFTKILFFPSRRICKNIQQSVNIEIISTFLQSSWIGKLSQTFISIAFIFPFVHETNISKQLLRTIQNIHSPR